MEKEAHRVKCTNVPGCQNPAVEVLIPAKGNLVSQGPIFCCAQHHSFGSKAFISKPIDPNSADPALIVWRARHIG